MTRALVPAAVFFERRVDLVRTFVAYGIEPATAEAMATEVRKTGLMHFRLRAESGPERWGVVFPAEVLMMRQPGDWCIDVYLLVRRTGT